jgi:hypothetical protein
MHSADLHVVFLWLWIFFTLTGVSHMKQPTRIRSDISLPFLCEGIPESFLLTFCLNFSDLGPLLLAQALEQKIPDLM